jgi:hypothetical protein
MRRLFITAILFCGFNIHTAIAPLKNESLQGRRVGESVRMANSEIAVLGDRTRTPLAPGCGRRRFIAGTCVDEISLSKD